MKKLIAIATTCTATCAALLVAQPAAAQFAKPADAIEYRESAMTLMSAHFGRIGAMAQGRVPFDAKVAADNAEILAVVSKLPWQAFGPGTDSAAGKTKAKPEIWTEGDKFKAAAQDNEDKIAKLNVAAKGGDINAIKAAFGEVGQSCKSCHDSYRAK